LEASLSKTLSQRQNSNSNPTRKKKKRGRKERENKRGQGKIGKRGLGGAVQAVELLPIMWEEP
jgi:hypothetical protein